MNRFKNLSTRTKLMVNIGLFVLIMIITTGLSIKEMGELSPDSAVDLELR